VRVHDGVVNITDTDHEVYPGVIRRTVLEVDGHLFIYTQGSGENRYKNQPLVGPQSVVSPTRTGETILSRAGGAIGNDVFGPLAFQALDKRLLEDVQRIRGGQALEHLYDTPKRMPPAILYNPARRGTE